MSATVAEVMTASVFVVRGRETVAEVRHRMRRLEIHALPVVADDDSPAGIVTTTDLLEECAPETRVDQVMSPHVHTVEADAEVAVAARIMRHRHIHHLLVTRGRQVVGLVSAFDLIRVLAEPG